MLTFAEFEVIKMIIERKRDFCLGFRFILYDEFVENVADKFVEKIKSKVNKCE